MDIAELGSVDVALVSHDQHPDNLDAAGRALLDDVPRILTTADGARRLGGRAEGLDPYEHRDVPTPGGGELRITALPALHGPAGAEPTSGPLVGFLLSSDGRPAVRPSTSAATTQASTSCARIRERVGPVDVALLFTGAASVPALSAGAPLTLTSTDAVSAARILGACVVVPVHCDGWSHYTEGRAAPARAFSAADAADLLLDVPPGQLVRIPRG